MFLFHPENASKSFSESFSHRLVRTLEEKNPNILSSHGWDPSCLQRLRLNLHPSSSDTTWFLETPQERTSPSWYPPPCLGSPPHWPYRHYSFSPHWGIKSLISDFLFSFDLVTVLHITPSVWPIFTTAISLFCRPLPMTRSGSAFRCHHLLFNVNFWTVFIYSKSLQCT